jgi:hypothetical protein
MAAALTFILACFAPHAVHGAVFNIANGDVAGLISAIQTANAACAISTTINLSPGGTYTLSAVAENTTEYNGAGAVGLPVIRVSVIINGNGATIKRSGAFGTPDFLPLAVSGRTAAGPPQLLRTHPDSKSDHAHRWLPRRLAPKLRKGAGPSQHDYGEHRRQWDQQLLRLFDSLQQYGQL